jgi:hypothetical protein
MQLETGLFDDNWRIRQSSVHLLGDLLYRITGMSGAKTTASAHDDDTFGVAGMPSLPRFTPIVGCKKAHAWFLLVEVISHKGVGILQGKYASHGPQKCKCKARRRAR